MPFYTWRSEDPYAYDPNLTPDTNAILDMQRVFVAEGQLTFNTPLPPDRLIEPSFDQHAADKLGPYHAKS